MVTRFCIQAANKSYENRDNLFQYQNRLDWKLLSDCQLQLFHQMSNNYFNIDQINIPITVSHCQKFILKSVAILSVFFPRFTYILVTNYVLI